jgi:hypothetical protein
MELGGLARLLGAQSREMLADLPDSPFIAAGLLGDRHEAPRYLRLLLGEPRGLAGEFPPLGLAFLTPTLDLVEGGPRLGDPEGGGEEASAGHGEGG